MKKSLLAIVLSIALILGNSATVFSAENDSEIESDINTNVESLLGDESEVQKNSEMITENGDEEKEEINVSDGSIAADTTDVGELTLEEGKNSSDSLGVESTEEQKTTAEEVTKENPEEDEKTREEDKQDTEKSTSDGENSGTENNIEENGDRNTVEKESVETKENEEIPDSDDKDSEADKENIEQKDEEKQLEDSKKDTDEDTQASVENADKAENAKESRAVQLVWPVPGHTNLSQGFHDGNAIDISDGSIAGATVVAAIGGTVTHIYLCGDQHYGTSGDCNGFGTGLVIAGDDGRTYQYAHMQGGSIPSNVYRGARVEQGQTLGAVGTTGNSTGYHLHFAISIGNYWNASGINPEYENYTYGEPTINTSWDLNCSAADTTNAIINGRISVSQRVQFTTAGAYVWDPAGNLVAQPSEGTSVSGTYMDIRYDMGMELGIWLKPGTPYTYQFWATTGGKTYYSHHSQFSTTGDTPIDTVSLSSTSANLKIGDSLTLSATVSPSYANNKTITWSSDNPAVATVSDGVINAIGEGRATITAQSHDGKSAQCLVVVEKKIISVDPVTPKIGGRAGDALRLNWQKNTLADGYIIEQYKGNKWVRIARIGNNSTITYRVENLSPFTTYQFRIKAFKIEGSDVWYSAYKTVSGKTNPATVKGFKIGGRAGDALRLNWTKNSTAAGYIIEQYRNGQWVRIARIANNSTTTYRIAGLKPYTTYQFRIEAFNFEGSTSLYSAFATISGKTNPSVMKEVKIGGRAGDALRINWERNSTASGYILEQYKDGKWVRIARIADKSVTTYRIEGLKPLTKYQFRINAFNFDGSTPVYGAYGAVSGMTNPSVMKGVTIGGRASDALRLNWTKNSTAAGYIIEQYKNGQWVRIARIANNSTITYRVNNLKPSTTYQFRIQAFNFEGSTPLYGAYVSTIGTTYGPKISIPKLQLKEGMYLFEKSMKK